MIEATSQQPYNELSEPNPTGVQPAMWFIHKMQHETEKGRYTCERCGWLLHPHPTNPDVAATAPLGDVTARADGIVLDTTRDQKAATRLPHLATQESYALGTCHAPRRHHPHGPQRKHRRTCIPRAYGRLHVQHGDLSMRSVQGILRRRIPLATTTCRFEAHMRRRFFGSDDAPRYGADTSVSRVPCLMGRRHVEQPRANLLCEPVGTAASK